MKLKIGCRFLVFLLFLVLFTGFILLYTSNIFRSAPISESGSDILNTKASTNPSAPTLLSDDVQIYDYYDTIFTNYYYRTSATASSSYYHTFWLKPADSGDDFNLYLYSNSSYNVLRGRSTNGADALDWVIVRPSISQYYYPKVDSFTGGGYAYIEWEDGSSTLSIGSTVSASLSISESIEIYMVYLSIGSSYAFTLDVPSASDYDFYLYYLNYGAATNSSGALRSSTNIGIALDETIWDFRPTISDYYLLLVTRQTGSGTFTIYSYSRSSLGLSDDSAYSESYSGYFSLYNYQTPMASSSYYYAFWLQPSDIDDDFNLNLYSDSGFSVLLASSTRGLGALDWVLGRPSSSQVYYFQGSRYTGTGTATVEWESSSTTLTIGTPVSVSLSSSECIEIYMIYLYNLLRYNFSLSVPDTADYDLYLFYLPLGAATNASGYINSSAISGYGSDESIQNFSPMSSDYYSIFVVRKAGSGSCTLSPSTSAVRLIDDNSISNLYDSTDSYYYQTSTTASSSYYHIFWLQPVDIEDNFNLYLYSNSGYSVLSASSMSGAGALDWVVVRPSSSQYYYPRVYRYSGTGYGYIEWESGSSTLSIGTPVSASLGASECIEIYRVSLTAGVNYNFTLDVPAGGDYDLYLYYLSSGASTNQSGAVRSSTRIGSGIDETIGEFRPTTSDYYIIAVVRQNGTGLFTLYSYSRTIISLTDESAVSQTYDASFSYYYYQTSTTASSSYYHVFWLQPTEIDDDLNLYLYSDSGYSSLQAASKSSADALDWVLVRPSSSQYYYPKIQRNSGVASAYIEWESGSLTLSNGYPTAGSLSSSECIEAYRISLSPSNIYNFILDVPETADYDFYIYYLNSGTAINQSGFIKSSTTLGSSDEYLMQYRPQITDDHLVLVVRRGGTGTYTLYCSSNTTYLYDESAFYDYYNASRSFYYYQTSTTVSTSYYHVMWLQPTEIDDDFNLYLYSDSSYLTLRATSLKGLGGLDWVAFRPSSSQYYYPKAHRYSGIGFMFIEWESSISTLSIGTPLSGTLGDPECIEVYMVSLSAGITYNFTLDVPSGADYDLYLYYLTSGGATNSSGALRSSTRIGTGLDETIGDFRAPSTDYYMVLVARQTGAGTFTLYSYSRGIISLTDETPYSEFYGTFTNYTYQTGSTASPTYYHAFWLLPVDIDDDFNLYLYSNSGYSILQAASTSGIGALDWMMVRPSSSQYYYPLGHRYSGTGNAYIEWEIISTSLSIGTSVSISLSASESIETYRVQLCTSLQYNFSLSVPDTADYDLYLYYLPLGTATNASGYINSSRISGNGYDETIQNFSPEFTDFYSIFVVRKGGSGSFTLFSSSNAVRLVDDNSIYNLYNSTASYYYQTNTTASSSYYHVFWLQPLEVDDDFNLYVYSNEIYSILRACSTRGAGALDWVVIRPSSSQFYYPRGHRYTGVGNAYIEWESSSTPLINGTSVSGDLNLPECIEVYNLYLIAGTNYDFTLNVPNSADYDLFLFYLNTNSATNQSGAVRSSVAIGDGIDERIGDFLVTTTDYYILAVVRQQGNGTFTLYSSSKSSVSLTDESAAFNLYSNSFSYYYYQTGSSASSSNYHVFWLQPTNINNDFNLYLYSNNGYSTLLAASTSSIGALDWVIVRPSSSQYYYPKIHRNLGVGSAFIEWEVGSSSLDSTLNPSSGVLNTSECIEAYRISLSTSYTYNFNLDVPDGADFDLYLYYLSSGTAVNQSGFVRTSRNSGSLDESIFQHRPQVTSDHIVLVVRRSGTGIYSLYVSSNSTYLNEERAVYEYYNSSLSSSNYLTNGYPSTSYCHVVWLHPMEIEDDFNLYLYSNSGYSTLMASSTRSAGAMDWVIFRPSSSQFYYPKVQRTSGVGYAFIEWEAGSSTLSIGTPLSASLNYSECLEIYGVSLTAGTPYNFTLNVPSGADYDLYLYYLSSGNAISWNNYVGSSINSGSGIDEKIVNFSASYSDYLILVVRNSGTGSFSLLCVPNIRILLSDDTESGQSYGASYTNVYYRTSSLASSAYYHVVWLQSSNAFDDFDLYLFSDNSYSNFKALSTSGGGCLDWVLFYPNSSQYYYPMVDTKADTGTAYIEWEDSSATISSESYYSGSLYYYDCIELYQTTLSTSKKYAFSLSVPSGGDFDLYLYYLNPGSAVTGSMVYLMASIHSNAGYDESIDNFQPTKSGNYAIIAVRKSGSGSYSLHMHASNFPTDPLNPATTTLLIIVGIAIIGVSAVAIHKRKEIWVSPPISSQSNHSTSARGSDSRPKPKAYKESEVRQPEAYKGPEVTQPEVYKEPWRAIPHHPQISEQKVRSFDYYCLYCGKLVRAGKKCQRCD